VVGKEYISINRHLQGNTLEKIFLPSQSRNTLVWGLVLVAIIDTPILLFLWFGSQGPTVFLIILGILFLLIDGLILSLTFLGKKMSFKVGENDVTVHFGFSKRIIPYASISAVQISDTTLLLRLFGASWPGLHWGLYKAKDVGNVWVYSTKRKGDFALITLVDGKQIALSPENPQMFFEAINARNSTFGTASRSEVEQFDTSRKVVYAQVLAVVAAFGGFLTYVLWIYQSLPEIIPVHFDINWNPNRWGHKSELFIIAGIAAVFPIINTVLALKFGRYGKEFLLFLGVVFIFIIVLFFGIVNFTQSLL
jgi:hypothetical protein